MKWSPGALFCEQVGELTRVFSQWNECEQTVVLYALLRRIPAVQARFLAQAVQHSLHSVSELNSQELNANSPGFINSLLSETTETAINQLLTHLPLLRPGNSECKQCYLVAIPELVSHCVSTGQYTEQTQQLLSYTLIHPAITSQDRRSLTQWLRHLEERISGTPPIHSLEEYTTTTPRWDNIWPRTAKQHQHQQQQQQNESSNIFGTHPTSTFNLQYPSPVARQRRSNSLTPPIAAHHLDVVDRSNNTTTMNRHKPRSFSVSGEHAGSLLGLGPLSPQSSCASSGSEGRLDEASTRTVASGMKDVAAWLKTLRLHKYSYLFTTLSYEEMLELTEERLAEQGVTKGARHKLALSIAKLQQRHPTLLALERDLLQPNRESNQQASFSHGQGIIANALDELKVIIATPMKPSQENDPSDIPAQFTKVMGKLCSRLALESMDEGILLNCVTVLEKVLQHDSFTPNQKEKIQQWRNRLGNPRPTPKWQHNYGYNRRYCNPSQHNPHNRKPSLNLAHVNNGHAHGNTFALSPHRNSISTPYLQNNQNQSLTQTQNSLHPLHVAEKRPSLQETSLEQLQKSLQRTYSAPRDNFLSHSMSPSETTDPEINSRLESLCLRMTEQAIGGFGEA
ncbi:protein Smaug homolog 1 isoform X1 [Neodiprion virginianus]|uniref:protein Smaug homolog 1 isoform X1 n=1 Tax=Neodiprion fabricii TaxID=2872261 RepID=UPI001ED94CC3|nr:protein Smaug homolog 1 isoform X1 [Neodiprion fabricii]XP_046432916.1 protein Smaug homolog 1 isoform X1 [Neodiprion fabricii]XP_046626460.1 protein Smaug homolog 1 isoform X1 [Neodiprion virginianus]XP_046626461.1 protein Smaug homolog 1 isoform X1 [Neodiprion virginianus]